MNTEDLRPAAYPGGDAGDCSRIVFQHWHAEHIADDCFARDGQQNRPAEAVEPLQLARRGRSRSLTDSWVMPANLRASKVSDKIMEGKIIPFQNGSAPHDFAMKLTPAPFLLLSAHTVKMDSIFII